MKLTPEAHQDLNTIPIILNVLSQFLKSTQPGIAAAEGHWIYPCSDFKLTRVLISQSEITKSHRKRGVRKRGSCGAWSAALVMGYT